MSILRRRALNVREGTENKRERLASQKCKRENEGALTKVVATSRRGQKRREVGSRHEMMVAVLKGIGTSHIRSQIHDILSVQGIWGIKGLSGLPTAQIRVAFSTIFSTKKHTPRTNCCKITAFLSRLL